MEFAMHQNSLVEVRVFGSPVLEDDKVPVWKIFRDYINASARVYRSCVITPETDEVRIATFGGCPESVLSAMEDTIFKDIGGAVTVDVGITDINTRQVTNNYSAKVTRISYLPDTKEILFEYEEIQKDKDDCVFKLPLAS